MRFVRPLLLLWPWLSRVVKPPRLAILPEALVVRLWREREDEVRWCFPIAGRFGVAPWAWVEAIVAGRDEEG